MQRNSKCYIITVMMTVFFSCSSVQETAPTATTSATSSQPVTYVKDGRKFTSYLTQFFYAGLFGTGGYFIQREADYYKSKYDKYYAKYLSSKDHVTVQKYKSMAKKAENNSYFAWGGGAICYTISFYNLFLYKASDSEYSYVPENKLSIQAVFENGGQMITFNLPF